MSYWCLATTGLRKKETDAGFLPPTASALPWIWRFAALGHSSLGLPFGAHTRPHGRSRAVPLGYPLLARFFSGNFRVTGVGSGFLACAKEKSGSIGTVPSGFNLGVVINV